MIKPNTLPSGTTNPIHIHHSHKKRKDSLEGSLDRVLFAAELEFPKILVPTQATSEFIKCKHLMCRKIKATVFYILYYSGSTDISSFYYADINLFLIDYACYKLCNYMVAPLREQLQELSLYRSFTLEEKHCCSYYHGDIILNRSNNS